MRIFVSYSSGDGLDYAKKLKAILGTRGHDCFVAEHGGIYPSEELWDIIPKEILNRDLTIFLITQSYRESKGQKEEYSLVCCNHTERMALVHKRIPFGQVFERYPLLKSKKAVNFDDSDLSGVYDRLASDLVRMTDRRQAKLRSEYNPEVLPDLTQEGLDSSGIERCIYNLRESFERNTIVPYVTKLCDAEDSLSTEYVTIGFNHQLPRFWFFPKEKQKSVVSNDFMFQEYGRDIALAERQYLQESILKNDQIPCLRKDFTSDNIPLAVKEMSAKGFQPNFIFPTINQYVEMARWQGKTRVEYGNQEDSRLSNAVLVAEEYKLQIVPPLGSITRKAILLNGNAVLWHVFTHRPGGVLFVALGNSQYYPTKFVQAIAFTRARCELEQKGILTFA
jgi:hypothetical protein